MDSLLKNLRAGGELTFVRPVGRFRFYYGSNQLTALIAASVAVVVLNQYLTTEAPRVFYIISLGTLTCYLVAYFIGFYLVTAIQRTPTMFVAFAVIVISAHLFLFSITALSAGLLPQDLVKTAKPTVRWIVYGWSLFIVFRAVRMLYGLKILRGLVLTIAFAAPITAVVIWVPFQNLWYTDVSKKYGERGKGPPNVERTYYAQPGLIKGRVEALAKNRPQITDLYFLGFAGDGNQDVFMREVRSVTQLFDEQFDTKDRSMMLINNRATLRTDPLANMHNLSAALRGIGAAMDADNDILFLFLTSHGWRDATLSTAFWPFKLNNISANGLGRTLNKSGIKWRVIVVSACYSGSFIKALQNDHTLVIRKSVV